MIKTGFKTAIVALFLLFCIHSAESFKLQVLTPPEVRWNQSVTAVNVTFDLSTQIFVPGTVVQANCFVQFDRFSDSNSIEHSIVFKAGDKPLAKYEIYTKDLSRAFFRSSSYDQNLRNTKHQVLDLDPSDFAKNAISLLIKPKFADRFSCDVEINRNKGSNAATLHVYPSEPVFMTKKPLPVEVTLKSSHAPDLALCEVYFRKHLAGDKGTKIDVCYYDYASQELEKCQRGIDMDGKSVPFQLGFEVDPFTGPGECRVFLGKALFRSKERFVRS